MSRIVRGRWEVTSQEIKNLILPPSDNIEFAYVHRWLREIAYQLAVMNERNDVPKLKHNPFGESTDEEKLAEWQDLITIRNSRTGDEFRVSLESWESYRNRGPIFDDFYNWMRMQPPPPNSPEPSTDARIQPLDVSQMDSVEEGLVTNLQPQWTPDGPMKDASD